MEFVKYFICYLSELTVSESTFWQLLVVLCTLTFDHSQAHARSERFRCNGKIKLQCRRACNESDSVVRLIWILHASCSGQGYAATKTDIATVDRRVFHVIALMIYTALRHFLTMAVD
jgi:hypothetical protein